MGDKESGPRGPRCIALVGPFQSGKTTLLEAILARTGAIQRQGTVDAGTTVGDAGKEARLHKMSVELTVATTTFMGDSYTFLDCPGSVEFVHDMRAALPAIDAAVVVCEADDRKVAQLQLILRELEDLKIPRFLFLNKIDKSDKEMRESLKLLQPASRVPLLLRQIPIFKNEIITGFIDLALERAYVYREHAPSEVIALDGNGLDAQLKDARFSMLETLADHDDELMEQLLADIPPPRDRVFDDLAKELRDGVVCPVLMGVAARTGHLRVRTGPRDPELRRARVCYDHLAGDAAVRMYDRLQAAGMIAATAGALRLTKAGERFFSALGIDLDAVASGRRPLCRACLDWSERRHHLAGALGAALLDHIYDRGWAERAANSRVVTFTKAGAARFEATMPWA